MPKVSFTLEGRATYDAMIAKLESMPDEISANEFEEAVHEIFLDSQERVPVDTGALHDSGRIVKISG